MIKEFDRLTSLIESNELYYIYDFSYNLIDSQISLSFCENPDEIKLGLKVTFTEVTKISNERYHDPEDACLAEMHNYDFIQLNDQVLVKVNTGDSILEFITLNKPKIEDFLQQ